MTSGAFGRVAAVLLIALAGAAVAPTAAYAQRGRGGPPAPGFRTGGPDHRGGPPSDGPGSTPVPQKIASNPALAARLRAFLPPGMTLADAASGFRNEGQFIAALHVAYNLHIP